jgi:hypothetical protein
MTFSMWTVAVATPLFSNDLVMSTCWMFGTPIHGPVARQKPCQGLLLCLPKEISPKSGLSPSSISNSA